jgi:hypothetical protein
MKMKSTTGVLKDTVLITVEGEDDFTFLYGTVVKDYRHRWGEGDWMVSSFIKNIDTEDLIVTTQFSTYKIDNLHTKVTLSIEQFLAVKRTGVSPLLIESKTNYLTP